MDCGAPGDFSSSLPIWVEAKLQPTGSTAPSCMQSGRQRSSFTKAKAHPSGTPSLRAMGRTSPTQPPSSTTRARGTGPLQWSWHATAGRPRCRRRFGRRSSAPTWSASRGTTRAGMEAMEKCRSTTGSGTSTKMGERSCGAVWPQTRPSCSWVRRMASLRTCTSVHSTQQASSTSSPTLKTIWSGTRCRGQDRQRWSCLSLRGSRCCSDGPSRSCRAICRFRSSSRWPIRAMADAFCKSIPGQRTTDLSATWHVGPTTSSACVPWPRRTSATSARS
mmetsp:Transcript_148711/g.477553  ORF Transcript_148711/g.477553 Transcript_148711/m.477553 type:complete len:276 (+) Transcript_148711:290-1117(+)